MKLTHIILSLSLLLMSPSMSHSANLRFLDESAPAFHYTDEDFSILMATVQKALNEKADGGKLVWENPKTGHNGLVNPLNTFQENGTTCRKTRLINKAKDKIAETFYKLCKQASGEWKVAP